MKSRLLIALLLLIGGSRLGAAQPTELVADSLEMVSTEEESRAICVGNVILTGTNLRISCDRLEIIASRIGDLDGAIPTLEKFRYLLATGNVRLVQGDREVTCGRAEVLPREEKVILTEDPVLIDHGSEIVQRGSRMTLWRGENRVQVENVVLTGPPIKDLGPDARDAEAPAPPAP
jgi:lipopolysaccharide export system protein LptA